MASVKSGILVCLALAGLAQAARADEAVTFLFATDVHACRMAEGLSPTARRRARRMKTCSATFAR